MTVAVAQSPAVSHRLELTVSFGRAWVVESVRDIDAALRERAFAHLCKDFRFYELIEETLPGQFQYRYFILEHAATGARTVQPFFFIDQDITAGLPAKMANWIARLRTKWPRLLTMRMLMVGCAAAEGQLGSAESWVAGALHETIDAYAPQAKASLVLLKDFPSTYRESLALFCSKGYARVPSMPAARLQLDFATFEEYMQERLSKVYRKNLRRKFKALEGVPKITMEVLTDGRAIAGELHALYLQTHLRSRLRFERLTEEYFAEIGERMPDRVRFFLWRQEGRLIAFNLCMVNEGTLYDLDVGLDYAVALDLHLYFVTLRDVFEWSVKNGVTEYHTGPLNYDPKLHLRMRLAPQDLYAKHFTRWINPFFKLAMKYLEPTRHDPVLKRFENAHEL